MQLKIIPLVTGHIYCDKGKVITLGKDIDKMIYVPSLAWYIEGGKEKILVDTGMCSTEKANKYHYKGSIQKPDEKIDLALKNIGIDVKSIKKVILTHLHWDHCQNLELFKNASFFVQKDELKFALNPHPSYCKSYESEKIGATSSLKDMNFNLLKGDQEICDGISVISTKGHSPGHQSVIIETIKGKYIIAGDAVMSWENLKPDKKTNKEFIMIGRYLNMEEASTSISKIKKKADFILPGHEKEVLKKKIYP